MSKIGYIFKSYGSSFNAAVANTYGYIVLNGNNLPANSLIISSPVDENGNDVGSYSLIVTDYLSNPVRLTYTIEEGNGIVYSDDSLKVQIDNKTIVENDGKLSININNIVDNNTLYYDEESGQIKISYDNIPTTSTEQFGLYKIDGNTINTNEGTIFVDTSKLRYSNTGINTAGILIGDGKTVVAEQGVLSVVQDNIKKADSDSPGFIHITNNTLESNDGILSVNTENLEKCSNTNPGIVIPDNSTITFKDESLSVNINNLSKTNELNNGVFKYDESAFSIDNGALSFKNNDILLDTLNGIPKIEDEINKLDTDIDYLLNEYQVAISKPSILDFHCAQLLTGVLQKPLKKNESIDEMPMQFMNVVFMIATNCPFKIAVTFTDNIDPQFSLYEINYNDIFIYNGNEGLQTVYQTTEGKTVPLKFTFIGKNYYNDNKDDYSNKIKIKIVVSYVSDVNTYKEIMYSIIRYNSGYSKDIEYDDRNIENMTKVEY